MGQKMLKRVFISLFPADTEAGRGEHAANFQPASVNSNFSMTGLDS